MAGDAPPSAELVASIRSARDAVLSYRAAYLAEADWEGALVRFWAGVEARSLHAIEEVRLPSLLHTP